MKNVKRIIALLLAILMALTLCACAEKKVCDFCGEEYTGKTYDLSAFGRGYVCKNCYNILFGRAGANTGASSDTVESLPVMF